MSSETRPTRDDDVTATYGDLIPAAGAFAGTSVLHVPDERSVSRSDPR